MKISNLEEAKKRIAELEKEIKKLQEENEVLRNRKVGGRKKHNAAWTASYNAFAKKYENGMSIMEIVAEGEISRRTAYRYKTYYEEVNGKLPKKRKSDKK